MSKISHTAQRSIPITHCTIYGLQSFCKSEIALLIELPVMNTLLFKSTNSIRHNKMYHRTVTCCLHEKVSNLYLLPGIFLMVMLRKCVS